MNLRIDPSTQVPVFEQVVRQIKLEVALGRLRPHDRVPAVRELALELLINPNTVQKAYTELAREGVLYSRKGLGVFVGEIRPTVDAAERKRRVADAADRLISDALHLGLPADDVRRLVEARLKVFERGNGQRGDGKVSEGRS